MILVEAVNDSHRDSVCTSGGAVYKARTRGRNRVILSSTLYFPNIGGVENSIYHLGREYRKRGMHPVLLVSTGGDANATARWFEVKRMHGMPVLRYKFSSIALIRFLRAWMALRILRRRFQLMAMVARDQHSAVAALLDRQPCVYLVPGIHSVQHKPTGRNPLRWANYIVSVMMQRAALRWTPRVAVFSQAMAEAVQREAGRSTTEQVRPGVDASRFTVLPEEGRAASRRRLGFSADARIAVAVGRFSRQKRFDLALGALERLPEKWHLVLVGDGPLRNELERHVENAGLAHRVTFTGQVTDPETYLQVADVYLLTSDNETFGQVLVEAMACALPVVAFDPALPGVDTATNEVVPEEWLFKARRKDAEGLSHAWLEAAAAGCDPEGIARWTHERYSWYTVASQLVSWGSDT